MRSYLQYKCRKYDSILRLQPAYFPLSLSSTLPLSILYYE